MQALVPLSLLSSEGADHSLVGKTGMTRAMRRPLVTRDCDHTNSPDGTCVVGDAPVFNAQKFLPATRKISLTLEPLTCPAPGEIRAHIAAPPVNCGEAPQMRAISRVGLVFHPEKQRLHQHENTKHLTKETDTSESEATSCCLG